MTQIPTASLVRSRRLMFAARKPNGQAMISRAAHLKGVIAASKNDGVMGSRRAMQLLHMLIYPLQQWCIPLHCQVVLLSCYHLHVLIIGVVKLNHMAQTCRLARLTPSALLACIYNISRLQDVAILGPSRLIIALAVVWGGEYQWSACQSIL